MAKPTESVIQRVEKIIDTNRKVKILCWAVVVTIAVTAVIAVSISIILLHVGQMKS